MCGIMNIIAAGGCGISIADKVVRNVAELGDGFASVRIKYIDTSNNNINEIQHDPKDFFMVTTKSSSGKVIAGAGGERNSDVTGDVVLNTKEFLDKYKFTKAVTNEFNIVIFSAGGGSGSNIGSLLVKDMLERNIPTIAIVIGDSSNGISADNTFKVLDGLNKMTRAMNKTLSLFYINNDTINNGVPKAKKEEMFLSVNEKERLVNKQIFNLLTGIALFTSGVNESLDYKDMENFISPYHYKTVKMPIGLYSLVLTNRITDLPDGLTLMLARSLTDGSPINLEGVVLQTHKSGRVVATTALETYKDKFPLFLVSGVNLLDNEVAFLSKTIGNIKNITASVVVSDIDSGGQEDENGLVF